MWLKTFCTLVELGHFTRTAERLHMTQSGVSQHVRKLEQQLGAELLVREAKRFHLSDAGERLYRESQSVLQSLVDLQQVAEDSAYEGRVRVMSPGSVGLKLYPKLLQLQQRYPGLVIDYRFAPNAEVEKAMQASTLDVGFMTARSTLADIACTEVATEALQLVTPAHIEQPDWATLQALGFIDHPDGSHHANLLLSANYPEFQHIKWLEHKGFSNQIGMILEPVSMGLGFTVLPEHAVEAFAEVEKIRVQPLPTPVNETLYLCVHRHRSLARRMQTVIDEAMSWL
ncbi:LysR family transcriptional regulator [Reinekea thalattae]|uniref:LysR family transcriptional regulator n=1 Tax=Reinekea thalattae TaxID=2593301 RepID=UPI001FE75D95|nr:LysR family transcriptional regulator [Reinekea thalattae]